MGPIIESVKDYIKEFPDVQSLKDSSKLNVSYLPKESINFSIEEVPSENGGIISKDIEGNSERQFLFVLAAMFDYEERLQTMIENSGFFEKFQEWLEDNNEKEIYPKLRDGLTPISIECLTTGYLFYVPESSKTARYQIQCRLIYEKEKIK